MKIQQMFFLTLVFGVLIFSAVKVFAIGQISTPIVVKDALRGQIIKETLHITNSKSVPLIFELKATGDIVDWAAFYKDEELKTPISELEVSPFFYNEAYVVLTVPADAPNGDYEGTIDVITNASRNEQSSQAASVNFSVSREVAIAVSGKEVVDLEAMIIPAEYIASADHPIKIRVIYQNHGNVAVRPDVHLKIDSEEKTIFNAIFPYPDSEDAVKAGERKELPLIEWQAAGQPEGKYRALAKVMLDKDVIKEERFQFDIISSGAAAAVLGANTEGEEENAQTMVWYVLGGIVAVAVVLAMIVISNKRKNKNQIINN